MNNLTLQQTYAVSGAGTCYGIDVKADKSSVCIGIYVR
jgi:hypothetical protein